MSVVDLVEAAKEALIFREEILSRETTKSVLLLVAEERMGLARTRLSKTDARKVDS